MKCYLCDCEINEATDKHNMIFRTPVGAPLYEHQKALGCRAAQKDELARLRRVEEEDNKLATEVGYVDLAICEVLNEADPDEMSASTRKNLVAWHERLWTALSAAENPRMARIRDHQKNPHAHS